MVVFPDRCREWRRLASEGLDCGLSELDARRLERHLAGCATCASWLSQARASTELLRDAEPELPRRPIELQALRPWRLTGRTRFGAAGASAAAAVLAAALFGLTGGGPNRPSALEEELANPAHPCVACVDRRLQVVSVDASQEPRRRGVLNVALDSYG
jgi:hypothetical protein